MASPALPHALPAPAIPALLDRLLALAGTEHGAADAVALADWALTPNARRRLLGAAGDSTYRSHDHALFVHLLADAETRERLLVEPAGASPAHAHAIGAWLLAYLETAPLGQGHLLVMRALARLAACAFLTPQDAVGQRLLALLQRGLDAGPNAPERRLRELVPVVLGFATLPPALLVQILESAPDNDDLGRVLAHPAADRTVWLAALHRYDLWSAPRRIVELDAARQDPAVRHLLKTLADPHGRQPRLDLLGALLADGVADEWAAWMPHLLAERPGHAADVLASAPASAIARLRRDEVERLLLHDRAEVRDAIVRRLPDVAPAAMHGLPAAAPAAAPPRVSRRP